MDPIEDINPRIKVDPFQAFLMVEIQLIERKRKEQYRRYVRHLPTGAIVDGDGTIVAQETHKNSQIFITADTSIVFFFLFILN